MQIRVKTPTDGGEAEFLTKFYCDYKKYCLNLRKRTLTSELMNIRRYISTLLLLFGCIISLSAEVMTNVPQADDVVCALDIASMLDIN